MSANPMTPSLATPSPGGTLQSLTALIERVEGLWNECGRLGLCRVDDTLPMPQTSATTFLPPQRGDLARPVAGLLNTIPDVLATLRAHAAKETT